MVSPKVTFKKQPKNHSVSYILTNQENSYQKTLMKICIRHYIISYSNGLLPNDYFHGTKTSDGRDRKDGKDGVGCHLTDDGDYDMQNKKLTNLAEGTNNQDAVNRHQLETGWDDCLKIDGSNRMTHNLNMGNQYITNLNTIPTNYDMNQTKFYAVNVKLLDDLIKSCLKTDGSNFMQASLNMNEENIEYLKNPNLAHHGVNKSYVDGHLQDYLRLDGTRPMANDLSIGQYRVVRDNLPCFSVDSHGDLQMEADIDLNHHVLMILMGIKFYGWKVTV